MNSPPRCRRIAASEKFVALPPNLKQMRAVPAIFSALRKTRVISAPFRSSLHGLFQPHVVPVVGALAGNIDIYGAGGVGFDPEGERVGARRFEGEVRQLELLAMKLRGRLCDFQAQRPKVSLRAGLVEASLHRELGALMQPPCAQACLPFCGLNEEGPGSLLVAPHAFFTAAVEG